MDPSIPNSEQTLFARVLAGFDAPAYIRRARRVEQVYEDLLVRLRRERTELLAQVRECLGNTLHLAGAVATAGALLVRPETLDALIAEVQPVQTGSRGVAAWRIRWALRDLGAAVARFNVCWFARLRNVDLTEINELRDGYNRYYVIEKECVVRNALLAAANFRTLPPLTIEELGLLFPLLPVPQVRE